MEMTCPRAGYPKLIGRIFGAMTLVQSDEYPVAACVIKDLFQLSPQAVAPSLASFPPKIIMLHLPANVDKDALISLTREKSVTMLIVTLLTPGRRPSSNARQSLQLPVISSKKTWVGSMIIIS
jgi:hypothetical protein